MWGISAALLLLGYVNAVIVSAVRRTKDLELVPPVDDLPPIEAGGETPGSAFERIATLLDEVERTREAEETSALSRRRSRGSGAASAPPP